MTPGKRAVQSLSRFIGSAPKKHFGLPSRAITDDETCTSANCADRQVPLITKLSGASKPIGWHAPLGLGVGRALRAGHCFGGGPQTWSPSHVRHFSWRRYLPSLSDLRNAAQAPDRQVTNLLLAINIATYVATKFDRSFAVGMAMIPYQVAGGEWYRLLTCGFLHLNFIHLLMNMLSIHWLGPGLESAAGRGRFAAIYLVSILGGSFAQYHWGSWAAASLGASGGVFGLFGAYLVYRLRNRNYILWDYGDTSWLLQVVGINVALGLMAGGAISQLAHLGGALAGAGTCWLIGPRYRWLHGRVVDKPLLPLFRTRE